MHFIAHRGNTDGPQRNLENSPEYLEAAMSAGFDVEVDVWYVDGQLYLGHDEPQYSTTLRFLCSQDPVPRIWCHAKTLETLQFLLPFETVHCFFHDSDDATLTSKKYIWTFPGKKLYQRSIAVMPERPDGHQPSRDLLQCSGICSDEIRAYRAWYLDPDTWEEYGNKDQGDPV